jgi:hypothetical protein
LLTAHDDAKIQNFALYCVASHNTYVKGFMNLWVEPSEFGSYDIGVFGKRETWQATYEFEKHHVGPGGMANGKRHESTNTVIEPVSTTEADVTDDMLLVEVAEIQLLMATGRHNKSVVVKSASRSKFKRRTLAIDSASSS